MGLMIYIQRRNPQIKPGAVSNLPWLIVDLSEDIPAAGVRVILDMIAWNPGRQPGLDGQVAYGDKQQNRHEKGRLAATETHQTESATNNCQHNENRCKPREPAPQQDAAHQ